MNKLEFICTGKTQANPAKAADEDDDGISFQAAEINLNGGSMIDAAGAVETTFPTPQSLLNVLDVTNVDGEDLDTSEGHEPLNYLHGHGNLIPGLENELLDKAVGDKFQAVIKPEDAYGRYDESRVQTVGKEMFLGVDDIQPGM